MKAYILLFLAIVSEVIATSALKVSEGFSRLWPTVAVVSGYGAAFYLLSLSLKAIPLGIAYATWSGVGTVGVVLIGVLLWQEVLDVKQIVGIVLVVVGVILLNLSKDSVT